MKKILMYLVIMLIAVSSFLVSCSQTKNLSEADKFMIEHCKMMPEMDGCEKYLEYDKSNQKENLNQKDTKQDIKQETIDLDKLEAAKPSETIEILSNNQKINLSADMIKKTINGKEILMFGYNGQIPGPLIKVEQGSRIYLNFTNNLNMPTTLHSHGLRLDNRYDGVPVHTQKEIMPGESFEYILDFPDEGIYWYHPHVREDLQQELGLYGNFYVSPKQNNYYNDVNEEIPLILDDILIEEESTYPFYKNSITHSLMGRFGNIMLVNGDENLNLEFKKGDTVRFHITNVANTRIFNFTIPNAKMKLVGSDIGSYEKEEYLNSIIIAPAQRYTIEVYFEKEGNYKILNKNPYKTYTLANINILEEETQTNYEDTFTSLNENEYVIEDIKNYEKYFDKDLDAKITLSISMGSMMGMEMGNNMMIHDEEDDHTHDDSHEHEDLSQEDIAMIEHCKMMPQMQGCKEYLEMDEEYTNNFFANMHEEEMQMHNENSNNLPPIEWEDMMNMMNKQMTNNTMTWLLIDEDSKKENMDIKYKYKVGDKVKIRLYNDPNSMHPMQHPIHFHGQRFLVLEKDGIKNKNLVWKDTVLVETGSYVDILLDITNPGDWMAHCHIAEHLQSGMMMNFIVEEN